MSIVPSSPRTVSEWCQKDVMCSLCCSAPRFQYFSHLRKAALSSNPEKDKENGTGTQTPVQNLGNNWFNTIVPSSPRTVSEWCQKDVMCSLCCSAPLFQYLSHLRKAALSSSPEKDKENGTGTQTPVQNLGNNWFNTIVPSSPSYGF